MVYRIRKAIIDKIIVGNRMNLSFCLQAIFRLFIFFAMLALSNQVSAMNTTYYYESPRNFQDEPYRVLDLAINEQGEGVCAVVEDHGVTEIKCMGNLGSFNFSRVFSPRTIVSLAPHSVCFGTMNSANCGYVSDNFDNLSQNIKSEYFKIRLWLEEKTEKSGRFRDAKVLSVFDSYSMRPCIAFQNDPGILVTECYNRPSETGLGRWPIDYWRISVGMRNRFNEAGSNYGSMAGYLSRNKFFIVTEDRIRVFSTEDRETPLHEWHHTSEAAIAQIDAFELNFCLRYVDGNFNCKSLSSSKWIETIEVAEGEIVVDMAHRFSNEQFLLVKRTDGLLEFRAYRPKNWGKEAGVDFDQAELIPKAENPFQGMLFEGASIHIANSNHDKLCITDWSKRNVRCVNLNAAAQARSTEDLERLIWTYQLPNLGKDKLFGAIFEDAYDAQRFFRRLAMFANESEIPFLDYIREVYDDRTEQQQYFLLTLLMRFAEYHQNSTILRLVKPVLSAYVADRIKNIYNFDSAADFSSLQDITITFDATKILEILLGVDLPELQSILKTYPQLTTIAYPRQGEGPLGLSDQAILGLKESISPCISSKPREILSRELPCQQFLPPEEIDYNLNSALLPVAYHLLDYFYGM